MLSLEPLVQSACHNSALAFGVEERGFVREGYWTDLVLSRCGWSPLEGTTFAASVDTTILSGQVAWQGGRIEESARGRRLAFNDPRDGDQAHAPTGSQSRFLQADRNHPSVYHGDRTGTSS